MNLNEEPVTQLRCTFRPQVTLVDSDATVDVGFESADNQWTVEWKGELPEQHSFDSDCLRDDYAAPDWVRSWPGPFEIDYEVVGAPPDPGRRVPVTFLVSVKDTDRRSDEEIRHLVEDQLDLDVFSGDEDRVGDFVFHRVLPIQMVAIYDVTELTDKQRNHLEIAVSVQAESERDADFPGVPYPSIFFTDRKPS